jgi:hypothetical protein
MPWLGARKKTVTVMDANPEGKIMGEKDAVPEEHIMAAEEFLSAVAMKDAKAVAMAAKAMFQLFDAEPHVEGPHE